MFHLSFSWQTQYLKSEFAIPYVKIYICFDHKNILLIILIQNLYLIFYIYQFNFNISAAAFYKLWTSIILSNYLTTAYFIHVEQWISKRKDQFIFSPKRTNFYLYKILLSYVLTVFLNIFLNKLGTKLRKNF